jgi:hypothetical protein
MKTHDSQYTDEETGRRRDEVIKRMLNTPPQPRRAKQESKQAKEKRARKAQPKSPS